jgi:hypothetical protein
MHYQLVRTYDNHGVKYVVYTAHTTNSDIILSATPYVVEGKTQKELKKVLRSIMKDIDLHPPMDKKDCVTFASSDDDYFIDAEFDSIDEFLPSVSRKYMYE